jgi:Spy/CpxP family protein refolding chaperone
VRSLVICVALVGAVLCPPLTSFAQTYKWWQDAAVRRELALTTGQAHALQTIFQSNFSVRRTLRRELDRLEERVQRMMAQSDLDERHATALIEQLETVRGKRNAARTLMLFKMYRVLSPEQRQRLEQLQHGTRSRSQIPSL